MCIGGSEQAEPDGVGYIAQVFVENAAQDVTQSVDSMSRLTREVDAQHGVINLFVAVGAQGDGLRPDKFDFVGHDTELAATAGGFRNSGL
ncbi:hypothetical protein [Candidatus Skiveiella danica]|uniref:hypothetical protein n=1 Tax=Candidatus Skiveiella danica TaxID=3386177 RepID=UPI001DDDA9C2|nr:hypothetical protein [Betaproteobacteria bacterium]